MTTLLEVIHEARTLSVAGAYDVDLEPDHGNAIRQLARLVEFLGSTFLDHLAPLEQAAKPPSPPGRRTGTRAYRLDGWRDWLS